MVDPEGIAGFVRLADGTTLVRCDDDSVRPVPSETDAARLAAMPEAEIAWHAANDPDHLALDDAFWAGVDAADSVKIDADVLAYFRAGGEDYEVRINAVLRRAMRERTGRP